MSPQLGLFDPPPATARLNRRQEGRKRRDEGLQAVSQGWDAWLAQARAVARRVAQERGKVTSDDIHTLCPLPEGAHHNLMGAVFKTTGLVQIGWTQTERPEGHGRVIRVYAHPPA
jgi:hypothetical protein